MSPSSAWRSTPSCRPRARCSAAAARASAPRPTRSTCPVCLGLPGALPVLNRRAVELAVKAALALGCTVHAASIFARKNYFYPDLPKGYQISQYDRPLATEGALDFDARGEPRRVGIIRVHLEEDAGKSLHEGFPTPTAPPRLDFNRSGVPLIEIVSQPDLRSAAEAAEALQPRCAQILVAIGVNDGNMEEGSLRCDANVSVRPRRHRGIRREDRDQEPQLVPPRPARAGVRDRSADRGARERRARSSRRRGSGIRRRAGRCRCARKEDARRLPVFSRAGPAAAAASTRRGSRTSAATLPELPDAQPPALRRAVSRCPSTTPAC